MIRNVILHLNGELPMKADIESLPTAADAGLLCTNLRTLEGRKPISTEFLDSVFLIPYNVIRFIEVPRASIHASGLDEHVPPTAPELPAAAEAVPAGANVLVTPPPAVPRAEEEAEEELEHLEVDAELLRRIREA
jgi:hypothetical protein